MKVWGLTGGIAAGKSTAARIFAKHGAAVIDADALSRGLSQPGGKAYSLLLAEFGTADRSKLREKVFSDPLARKRLEAILHPLIRHESEKKITDLKAKAQTQLILYEAALLVESGRYQDFDGLIVIEATQELREKRLLERPGITPALAQQILSSQANDQERLSIADHVLANNGNLKNLEEQIILLLPKLYK